MMKEKFSKKVNLTILIMMIATVGSYGETGANGINRTNTKYNIPACGKKAYAFKHKEGIYNASHKFHYLPIDIIHEICKSGDYTRIPKKFLSCSSEEHREEARSRR